MCVENLKGTAPQYGGTPECAVRVCQREDAPIAGSADLDRRAEARID